MLNDWKNRIFAGWYWMRWLRLGLAVLIIIQAIMLYDWMFAAIGGVLLVQAVFNVGCCAGGSCYAGGYSGFSENNNGNDVTFEEIKK